MKKKIAYQGRPGAYSHLVCIKVFPNYEPVPCESFEEVFKKTENKETEISLIPIENSQAGRVADIHNLLPMSNLVITGEYFHKVSHHLLGCTGSSLDSIKTAESHLHALAQCKDLNDFQQFVALCKIHVLNLAARSSRPQHKAEAGFAGVGAKKERCDPPTAPFRSPEKGVLRTRCHPPERLRDT